MKRTLWIILLAAGMFFAGWFCRPDKGEPTVNELRGRLKMAAAARLSGEDPGKANFSESGDPPVSIQPLSSLGELLAVSGKLGRSRYELAVPVMEIIPRLAVTDLATVRRLVKEYADRTDDRRTHAEAYAALLFRWAMLQPVEAAQYSLSHPDLLGNLSEWNPLLLSFAAKQKPGEKDKLLAYVPKENRADMEEFLAWREAAGGDPAAILSNPGKLKLLSEYGDFSASGLAKQWLLQNPKSMLRWSGTLTDDSLKRDIRDVIMNYFSNLGGDRQAMEAKLALVPADLAAQARVEWLTQLPRSEARQELMSLLNDDSINPQTMDIKYRAANALVEQFAAIRQFSEAAQWASSLQSPQIRARTYENLADEWSRKDSLAASEWINSLPPGADRDEAVKGMISNIRGENPDAALVWANSLVDGQARKSAVNNIFRVWFSRNPAQAYQTFLTLSAEDQAGILPPVKDDSRQ